MNVALQNTFKNPLVLIGKGIFTVMTTIILGMIAFGESAGRARAASELARWGYHEEAKNLMLQGGRDD